MTDKKHWAVVGLGFGDEGKGSIVDYICATEKVDYVVRFNGGCQAAHNVVLEDGTHHTFSQYGSGTLRGVPTILSRFMAVEPMGFLAETKALESFDMDRVPGAVVVDEDCLITTPWHIAVNRHLEGQRGDGRHGSCGLGVGVTAQFALEEAWAAPRVRDITSGDLKWKMGALGLWAQKQGVTEEFDFEEINAMYQQFHSAAFKATSEVIKDMISHGPCVFEGAQGVLLDEWYGFHPHTTWSTTTFENIGQLVDDMDDVERIGVLRAYATRHGDGPLPTESDDLKAIITEEHNDDVGHQGTFRVGDFDMHLAGYAVAVCGGVDSIALTHMDVAESVPLTDVCVSYEVAGEEWWPTVSPHHDLGYQELLTDCLNHATPLYSNAIALDGSLERAIEGRLLTKVTIVSHGPTAADKKATVTAEP